jgi:hypothetical protein
MSLDEFLKLSSECAKPMMFLLTCDICGDLLDI